MIVTVEQQHQSNVSNDWLVWVQLEPGDPKTQNKSFLIGTGVTRHEAVSEAVKTLHEALETLTALQDLS